MVELMDLVSVVSCFAVLLGLALALRLAWHFCRGCGLVERKDWLE